MLLVLDNFEHLMTGVDLVTDILREAPEVKVLVTSREKLNLREEWLFDVEGLPYPAVDSDGATPETYDAVQLFAENARRARRRFDVNDEPDGVARICRLLAGSPLGLELAAALVTTHTCAQIADDIAASLDTLSAAWRNAPERHRSLRAVFEHSWRRLTPDQQRAFRRLSVFRGGFGFEAAQQVTGMKADMLEALVAKSLLHRFDRDWGESEPRYDLHDILRQYAAEMLAVAGERADAHARHAAYCVDFLRAQEHRFAAKEVGAAVSAMRGEIDNLRAAWQWLAAQRAIETLGQTVPTLHKFYEAQSWFQEGSDLFAAARQAIGAEIDRLPAGAQSAWGRLHAHEAGLLVRLGHARRAQELADVGLAVHRTHGDDQALAFALNIAGIARIGAGEFDAARTHLEEALALYRRDDNRQEIVKVLANLGSVAARSGDYTYAVATLQAGLSLCCDLGDRRGEAFFLNNLAAIHLMQGQLAKARTRFEECLPVCEETGNVYVKIIALQNLGEICVREGDPAQAQVYCNQGAALARQVGSVSQLARALKWLIVATIDLEDLEAAWQHLREGLRAARDSQSDVTMLDMLEAAAAWLLKTARREQAIDVLRLLDRHPATEEHTRSNARRLLDEVGQSSEPGEVASPEATIEALLSMAQSSRSAAASARP